MLGTNCTRAASALHWVDFGKSEMNGIPEYYIFDQFMNKITLFFNQKQIIIRP